jgi:hypothetical protein
VFCTNENLATLVCVRTVAAKEGRKGIAAPLSAALGAGKLNWIRRMNITHSIESYPLNTLNRIGPTRTHSIESVPPQQTQLNRSYRYTLNWIFTITTHLIESVLPLYTKMNPNHWNALKFVSPPKLYCRQSLLDWLVCKFVFIFRLKSWLNEKKTITKLWR